MSSSREEELLLLLAMFQRKYKTLAGPAVALIQKYVAQGFSAEKAINKGLSESGLLPKYEEALVESAITAAALGYGVSSREKYSATSLQESIQLDAWAPDGMNLSQRLHVRRADIRQAITDVLQASMRQGDAWIKAARGIYDGYGYGKITDPSELPQYLTDLVKQAKKVLSGDKAAFAKYETVIRAAEKQIGNLSGSGAPTGNMKQAFKNVFDATKDLNARAIDKAVMVAVEEKARYIADRIARTEMARAWGDGFFAKYQNDANVIAYRWKLNSRHPVFDICDVNASVDAYGLGKGVYPKTSFPKFPAHPHCMCLIVPVYASELEGKKKTRFKPEAVTEYIAGLDADQQQLLLGVEGVKQGADSWSAYLRNWQGHENPLSRFKGEDFGGGSASSGKDSFDTSAAKIPIEKLESYVLDKGHAKGVNKAIAFERALGYTKEKAEILQQAILQELPKSKIEYRGENDFGSLYFADMVLTGPNGKTANVRTSWIVEKGKTRLTSAYVKKGGQKQ